MFQLEPSEAAIASLGFDSVEDYQRFHGLIPDNVLGPITSSSIQTLRFCSRPDREALTTEELTKWPTNKISTTIKHAIPGFNLHDSGNILIDALQLWADVANLEFTFNNNALSNITLTVGHIDGPSGTLAWSELPNQSNRVTQKYDSGESWVLSSNPPQAKIDILAVMVHELGHALGLSHAPQSKKNEAIMAPFYNPAIRKPFTDDISRIQKLYGKPISEPKPDPNPNEPKVQGKILVRSIEFSPDGIILGIDELE